MKGANSMALNEVFKDADAISLPVPEGTASGTPLRIGILNAVAITDEGGMEDSRNRVNGFNQPTGGIGNKPGFTSLKLSGAWRVPVTGALTIGGPVYITSAGELTATAGSNAVWGAALRAKGTGKGDAIVKILQSAPAAAASA